ncbi:MAG: YbaN family protein [Dehalococcoidia bacterium]|nr:YbaN family protein [Dehalococcoidia bacterium]
MRALLIVSGTASLAAGIMGVFVPILPTTPFLLLSAACYMRSSRRFYIWLIGNRFFGEYVRNYIERRGIPLRVKAYSLALLWVTIGCSAAFATDTLWVRIVLIVIALGVTIHVLSLQTLRR